MKSSFKWLILISSAALMMVSCSKDLDTKEPVDKDPTVPATISGVTVVNGNGKATINYVVPNDPRLLYVKAVYTITNGKQYEVKASYYNNSLLVEGYADTLEHEVKLYSVSRSEVLSEPVIVKIKPLISPIWQVYKSLQWDNAVGGYNLSALNPSKANIRIIVTKPNVFKEYEKDNAQSVYTNNDTILSKVRQLDTNSHRFGFLVMDRWNNKTDTIYHVVKPLYETELPRTNFTEYSLPGDPILFGAVRHAWDTKYGWPACFTQQIAGGNGPHIVTFNTGTLARLSRVWIRPYPEVNPTRYYYLQSMKRFEIYGSANPNPNGALDNSWVKLGSYTITKPSGLPYGVENNLDMQTAVAGWDLDVDLSAPKVKYIRIRCLENWTGGTGLNIDELRVFGDPR